MYYQASGRKQQLVVIFLCRPTWSLGECRDRCDTAGRTQTTWAVAAVRWPLTCKHKQWDDHWSVNINREMTTDL